MEVQSQRLCQVRSGKGGRLSFVLSPAACTQLADALTSELTTKPVPDPYQQLPALVTRLRNPSTTGARGIDLTEGDIFLILKHKEAFTNLGRAAQGALHTAEVALNERASKRPQFGGSTKVSFHPTESGSKSDGAL